MRTKIILGLTAGLMSVAQLASAQGVNSGAASDTVIDFTSVVNPQTITIPVTDSFAGDTAFVNPNDNNNSVAEASFNLTDDATAPTVAANNAQSSSTAAATESVFGKRQSGMDSGFGDWLSLNTLFTPDSLTATTQVMSPVDTTPNEFASNPAMDNGADSVLRSEDKAGGSSKGGGRVPLLASPEPGTVSLLVFGGMAVASALRRRK